MLMGCFGCLASARIITASMARADQIKLLLDVLEVDGLLDENVYVDVVEILRDRRPDLPMEAGYVAIVDCFLQRNHC